MHISEYENYQEKKDHGSPTFPYTTYLCSIPLDFSSVPLHWHEEMEIIYIKKGKGQVMVDLEAYSVSAGTLVLILPGQLHSIQQLKIPPWNMKILFSTLTSCCPKRATTVQMTSFFPCLPT